MKEHEQILNSQEDFKFFNAIFDNTRYELVVLLADGEERTISQIAEKFPQDRSVISRHLDHLYSQKIVRKEKKSKYHFYTLDCEFVVQKFEDAAQKLRQLMGTE